jgi:hypothetical protein
MAQGVRAPIEGFEPAMSLTTIRVLLVEDEIMIRMMVSDWSRSLALRWPPRQDEARIPCKAIRSDADGLNGAPPRRCRRWK